MPHEPSPGPTALHAAVQGFGPRPSLDGFIDFLMEELGGARSAARMFADEIRASRPGSLLRTRLMEAMLRGMARMSTENALEDEHLISDDDLRRFIAERERLILQTGDLHADPGLDQDCPSAGSRPGPDPGPDGGGSAPVTTGAASPAAG